MKRINYLLLFISLIITGCSGISSNSNIKSSENPNIDTESNNNTSDSSVNGDKSSSGSSITPVPDSSYIDYDLNTSKLTSSQYPIGIYGDYVEFDGGSGNLAAKFSALSEKVKGDANGIFQTNYEQGLLDLFNLENEISIVINISNENLSALNNDYYTNNKESYRMCDLDIYYDELHFHYKQVGIRQKGNTSRGEIIDGSKINVRHYKLSFEETFDDEYVTNPAKWWNIEAKEYRKDRKFFGEDKLSLRWNRNEDRTHIREYYATEMLRNNGVLSQRTNLSSVTMKVGNTSYYLGIYLMCEQIDKGFIKRNFVKSSRNGDLYKLTWGGGDGATFENTNSIGIKTQYGSRGSNNFTTQGYTYDLKTNKSSSNHEALKKFINDLSPIRGADAYSFMTSYSDVNYFARYAATLYLLGDPDDLRGNYNNSYLYFTGDTNKAIFIPYDLDRVMGATGNTGGGNPTGSHAANVGPYDSHVGYGDYNGNRSYLFNKTIISSNSTQIRSLYSTSITSLINNGWMSSNKYQYYYNLAYSHYSSKTTTSSNVNSNNVTFSMNENFSLSGDNNLTVVTYMNAKVNTFNNNK